MTKDNMEVISITPGQTVKVEHFKHTDTGSLERNVQNEFDNRIECLMTPQVINKEISTETDWGLSGWDSQDSLKITTNAGDMSCDEGVAYIGGRRFIRLGEGSIASEVGNPGGSADYFVRIKYTVSTDTHEFMAEASESISGNDIKYITLALVNWNGSDTWSAETDLRASNTSLPVPAFLSGDTDGDVLPVLTVTQTGAAEQVFEVYGADVQFFESGDPFKHIIYGNDTTAIRIYSGVTNYVDLRADASTDQTLFVPNVEVTTQLDVASMTLSTTDISGALTIGDLTTLTLATAGASIELTNAANQTLTLQNQGAGLLNVDILGDLTPTTITMTGAISTSSTIGGGAITGSTITGTSTLQGTALNLTNTTNQIVLDSDGTTGTITMAALGGARAWTLPNGSGTFVVGEGSSALSVSASGILTIEDPLTIANGGTSATSAGDARTALGLAIGSDVQAHDPELDDLAGLSPTSNNFIVGTGSAWAKETPSAARTSLGLDTNDAVVFGSLSCGTGQVKDVHNIFFNNTCRFIDASTFPQQYMYGYQNYQYPYIIAGGWHDWGMPTPCDVGRNVVDVTFYYYNTAGRPSSYYAVWGYYLNGSWTDVTSKFLGTSWSGSGYAGNAMTIGSHTIGAGRSYFLKMRTDINVASGLGLSGCRIYFDE